MEKKSQNNYFYEENDIIKIKQIYLKYKEQMSDSDMKYIYLNSTLHSVFLERYDLLFKENDLKEIKEKLKLYDKEKNTKEITKINEIINEAQHLKKQVSDDFSFYNRFLLIQKTVMKTGLLRKKYIIKYAKMLQIL